METKQPIQVFSEIGELGGVILHTPGPEVQNMTPKNAERALYSDILNLAVVSEEYQQFQGVLEKVTHTYQVKDLLAEILQKPSVKAEMVEKTCNQEGLLSIREDLLDLTSFDLAKKLMEGVELRIDSLTSFLSKERFALKPLHNFFFTRDASVSIGGQVLISKMANQVREREALIMESIFNHSPQFSTKTINPVHSYNVAAETTIEGGDIIIAREDVLIIGMGKRTSSYAIDYLIEQFKQQKGPRQHLFVQELPSNPESFIHLDMVFTFLDRNACMVYEPLILKPNKFHTIHLEIENGEVLAIRDVKNLLEGLKSVGMDLKPIYCGGRKDLWMQEREQWHSGANFFAFAPGKVIGYARNTYTMEEMDKNGFEILKAQDVASGLVDVASYERCAIALEGSELARGGGGARCMTMPVFRKPVEW